MSATVTLWPTVGRIGVQCGTGTQLTAFREKGGEKPTIVVEDKQGNTENLLLDVVGIEITRPTRKVSGHADSYRRVIRFRLFGGRVLDVFCAGELGLKYIKQRSVKKSPPVKKQPTKWITPKVYKGTSDREHGLLERIRKLFSW